MLCLVYVLFHFTSQASDSAPDVWLRLLERCASISSCQPALIRDLGLQLVEQQDVVTTQQHTITQVQQQTPTTSSR